MQQSFNKEREKSEKGDETIEVIQKDLKLAKAARKLADNSTSLHSDSFEIIIEKLQGVNTDYGG